MFFMICGKTLRGGISNKTICYMVSVEKLREIFKGTEIAMV